MSGSEADEPQVPSIGQLAWLLLMQPRELILMHLQWGFGPDALWTLRRRRADPTTRRYLSRSLLLLLLAPLIALAAAGPCALLGPVDWALVVGRVLGALARGLFVAAAVSVVGGVALGMSGAIVGAVMTALLGASQNLVLGVTVGVALGVFSRLSVAFARFPLPGLGTLGLSLTVAAVGTVALIQEHGTSYGLIFAGVFLLAFLVFNTGLPWFLLAAPLTLFAPPPSSRETASSLARRLPYRHIDLLFPLPRLSKHLIAIGTHAPKLGRQCIDEAAASIAQQTAARRALLELQTRSLAQAARDSDWTLIATLAGPFFPSPDELAANDPLQPFIRAARDLLAAETGGSQIRRLRQLDSATKALDAFQLNATLVVWDGPRFASFSPAAQRWLEVIERERDRLEEEISAAPELPMVFKAGLPLDPQNPDEVELFRVRRDLVAIVEQDLDDDRRGVLLLNGQRRMGKSSLLAMLPHHLGTSTILATRNLQRLSGEAHRETPHRLVVETVAAALAEAHEHGELELPPTDAITDTWGSALSWLEAVDAQLGRAGLRLIVALDEIEALQEGVNEGWGDLSFLNFIRAAGDALYHLRLLLVCAYRLSSSRLGPAWVDRLISAKLCRVGPLTAEDAEQLLRRPVSYFPTTVFDDEQAATILAQTGTHPYLIQLVGEQIVNRLRADKRMVATSEDVAYGLDLALNKADTVFADLWNELEEEDRALLSALARGQAIDVDIDVNTAVFRSLAQQDFVALREDAPTFLFPMFGRWIRDHRAPRPPGPGGLSPSAD